jgi:hypothetical protein
MALDAWQYAPNVSPDALVNYQYMELRESGKESYSPGNSTANRCFMVAWDDRAFFLDDLLGYSYLQGTTIHRVLPDVHPEIDNFYATDAQVDGMGVLGKADNNSISWTNAKVTTNYKPAVYSVLPDSKISPYSQSPQAGTYTELDRYTSRQYGFSADYLTINGAMKFVTAPNVVLSNPPGRITQAMQLNYTWHQVPAKDSYPFQPPNIKAIQNCLGKVNSVVFDINGGNFPAGTVLFIGVDPKMMTPLLTNDVFYWEITYNFLVRNNGAGLNGETAGHQYIYRIDLGKYDLITNDGTFGGQRIYQTADLNTLWTIDP